MAAVTAGTQRCVPVAPRTPADVDPEDRAARETARREAVQDASRCVGRHLRAVREVLRAVALEHGIVSPREG